MAYGNPGYEDMEAPASSEKGGEMDHEHEEGHKGEEYPLPIGVLAGKADEFNVGDEVVLRITAKHPDQIFVAYSESPPDKKEAKEPEMEAGESGGESPMKSMYE